MSAERLRLHQIVERWGLDAQVEVWGDNTVWIARADGTNRVPLREWSENDVTLDADVVNEQSCDTEQPAKATVGPEQAAHGALRERGWDA